MEARINYKRQWALTRSHKNFHSQIAVNENLYEISIKYSIGSKTRENDE